MIISLTSGPCGGAYGLATRNDGALGTGGGTTIGPGSSINSGSARVCPFLCQPCGSNGPFSPISLVPQWDGTFLYSGDPLDRGPNWKIFWDAIGELGSPPPQITVDFVMLDENGGGSVELGQAIFSPDGLDHFGNFAFGTGKGKCGQYWYLAVKPTFINGQVWNLTYTAVNLDFEPPP